MAANTSLLLVFPCFPISCPLLQNKKKNCTRFAIICIKEKPYIKIAKNCFLSFKLYMN